jgi:hypothetical protein
MKHPARRASLIVVLRLLTSVGTASAECAWVLWVEQPSGSNQWSLSTNMKFVFDTSKECEQSAAVALDARIREVEGQEKAWRLGLDAPKFFQCLPDAIDPRGPKAR